ncbi:MAG: hypothetical protein JRI25_00875 [Deltaproteobacteria bacterium]|nr:hypothetical protein [Deltaproteobacteria bacterium]MBW2253131.1 hypothetical protein [Deltaproteobacteria bacterium]
MSRTLCCLVLAGLLGAPLFSAPAWAGPEEPAWEEFDRLPPEARERLLHREREIFERIREHDPGLFGELMGMREAAREDPHVRRVYLARLHRASMEMHRIDRDPERLEKERRMHELRRELHEEARGMHELEKAEHERHRAEMERTAGELFDLRQAERRARLEEMERRLEEMRVEIEAREAEREEIIRRHLDQLILGPAEL